LNWFAPAAREGDREDDPDPEPDDALSPSAADGVRTSVVCVVGEGGRPVLGGAWNGRSVGEIYLREDEGLDVLASGSSSMGVIGGGGVSGGEGDVNGLPRKGDDSTGVFTVRLLLGRRDRCERRERVEAPAGEPMAGIGVISPPAASKILPRSLPYAGGGASVPTLGAKPHFFTLASIKTNPDCPRLT